jgi:hypothetical protein
MKPIDKALAVRRNWPFRSPDPALAYRRRVALAQKVLDLAEKQGPRQVRYEARRLFVVAACAAFEAFWRDVVRDLVDHGGRTLHNSPNLAKLQFSIADVKEILGRRLTLGELVASAYAFQSPEAVEHALSDVLGIKVFGEFANAAFRILEVPRKNRSTKRGPLAEFSVKGSVYLRLLPTIRTAFSIRHDTVHDAGTRHWPSLRATLRLENAMWQFNSFMGAFLESRTRKGAVQQPDAADAAR